MSDVPARKTQNYIVNCLITGLKTTLTVINQQLAFLLRRKGAKELQMKKRFNNSKKTFQKQLVLMSKKKTAKTENDKMETVKLQ